MYSNPLALSSVFIVLSIVKVGLLACVLHFKGVFDQLAGISLPSVSFPKCYIPLEELIKSFQLEYHLLVFHWVFVT